jgi:hypothetical protein
MTPMVVGALWVLAATLVALLPLRLQFPPAITLLTAAPVLLVWIGVVHGWVWLAVGLIAFVSMFRHPLRYFLRRALGRPAPLPKELQK